MAVVAALIALSIGGVGGSAQASATTSAPSRGESRHPAAAVHVRAEHHARVARRAGWSAGPVARWTGYSRSGGSLRVREVQRTLRRLDRRPGPVDGLFGPLTERAVVRFQRAEALPQDGIVGPLTLRRLHVRAGERRPTTSSPKSGARSPDRPRVGPAPQTRPAPAPSTVPAEPAHQHGPVGGAILLVAFLGFLVVIGGLVTWRGRAAKRAEAVARPAAALSAGPAIPGRATPSNGSPNGASSGSRSLRRPRLAGPVRGARGIGSGDVAAAALQDRSGGRPGDVLSAPGAIPIGTFTQALGRRLRIKTLRTDVLTGPLRWGRALRRLGRGGGQDPGRVVPVSAAMFVEGSSRDPLIGDFAGFVFAMALPAPASVSPDGQAHGSPDSRAASTRYCVHDVTKAAPVWVREDEIVRTAGAGRAGELRGAGKPVVYGIGAGPHDAPSPGSPLGVFPRTRSSRRLGDVH